MKTASSLMTPNPKMVGSGETLHDVVRLFLEQGITSSPVINPLGEVLGVLSELSLVKAYMLHKAKFTKNFKVGHHIELLEPATFVRPHAPLAEVLKEMIGSPTHRLLVRDDKGRTVGIISPKDLMRAMLGEENPSQTFKQRLAESEKQLKENIQKLQSVEKALEVYQQTFQETPYMMHAVDAQGKILMANKCEHEVLGYRDGELVGKSIFDIYSEPMHEEAARGLKKVIETGFHHITYTTLKRKDGSAVRCDIASSSLHDSKGEFASTITVLRPMDSEEMLRILNGIVDDKKGPLARYIFNKEEA